MTYLQIQCINQMNLLINPNYEVLQKEEIKRHLVTNICHWRDILTIWALTNTLNLKFALYCLEKGL